jgi:hypothetical protein
MGTRPPGSETSYGHDDAQGQQAAPVTGDTPAEPPPVAAKPEAAKPADEEKATVPLKALQAERTKRQELEQRLKELEDRAKAPEPEPKPIPNPAVDPAAYHAHIQEQQANTLLNVSEILARQRYADLDEKIAAFREEADRNPALYHELFRQKDPYDWVYQQGKARLALKEIGTDPEAYRQKVIQETEASLREKLRAEVMAELGIVPQSNQDERPAVPVSMASARAASQRSEVYRGPVPLGQLLKMGTRK